MAAIDFKQVKQSNQRDKDIVYGYMKQIQCLFPGDNPYFTIVQLIQDLCLLYYRVVIDTKILTDDETQKLLEMVNDHTNNIYKGCWKLLFRASRDGFKRYDFYLKCDKMNNTICIIHSAQNNVFGGFTSISWDKSKCKTKSIQEDDPFAFIYLVRSNNGYKPQIFPVQNNGKGAIQQYRCGYLSFGDFGDVFYMDQRGTAEALISVDSNSECFGLNCFEMHLNGNTDNVWASTTDIEVFQLVKS